MSKSFRNKGSALALAAALLLPQPLMAQDADVPEENAGAGPGPAEDIAPPYEDQLERLSEVLGSLHFLALVCEAEEGSDWRQSMGNFIEAEAPSPLRRAKFIGLFNRGYEGFDALYTRCTAQAAAAKRRYLAEGRALSEGIVNRYGN